MNIEKIYNDLKEIKTYNGEEQNKLEKILKELQVEIITNGKVNKGILSTAKKIFKEMVHRPIFEQVFNSQSGNYCICNGYALIDYGKSKDNIPKELYPYININKNYEKPNFCYETLKNDDIKYTEILKIKDIEKLYKYNKTQNTDNEVQYVLGNNNVLFSPRLMLDFIKLSGIKLNEIEVEYGEQKSPINLNFKDENIKAIVLPIFYKEEKAKENYAKFKEIMEID